MIADRLKSAALAALAAAVVFGALPEARAEEKKKDTEQHGIDNKPKSDKEDNKEAKKNGKCAKNDKQSDGDKKSDECGEDKVDNTEASKPPAPPPGQGTASSKAGPPPHIDKHNGSAGKEIESILQRWGLKGTGSEWTGLKFDGARTAS